MLHKGRTCTQFFFEKNLYQLKHSFKFCFLFAFLPGLYTHRRTLHKPSTWKYILKKYIRTVVCYAIMGAAPYGFGCLTMPFFRNYEWPKQVCSFYFGAFLGFAIENPKRHL